MPGDPTRVLHQMHAREVTSGLGSSRKGGSIMCGCAPARGTCPNTSSDICETLTTRDAQSVPNRYPECIRSGNLSIEYRPLHPWPSRNP